MAESLPTSTKCVWQFQMKCVCMDVRTFIATETGIGKPSSKSGKTNTTAFFHVSIFSPQIVKEETKVF